MIGKAKWFQRRKYGGWGVCPKTWQGWAYVAILIGLLAMIQILPLGSEQTKFIVTIVLVLTVIVDVVDIMVHLPKDEREQLHEATAERNAIWVMVATLGAGICWQAYTSQNLQNPQIDPVIIIALLAGLITKAITNIYLDRKN